MYDSHPVFRELGRTVNFITTKYPVPGRAVVVLDFLEVYTYVYGHVPRGDKWVETHLTLLDKPRPASISQ